MDKKYKISLSISIDSEKIFYLKIYEELYKLFSIEKSKNKYSNIDFIFKNIKTNNIFYLELKERNIKYINYNSFFMGLTKLNNINKFYFNCLLVWKFDSKYFYIKFNEDLLKSNKLYIKSSYVYEIKKNILNNGSIDDLIEYIKVNF